VCLRAPCSCTATILPNLENRPRRGLRPFVKEDEPQAIVTACRFITFLRSPPLPLMDEAGGMQQSSSHQSRHIPGS